MRLLGLIPARAGSKRVPHKNRRLLAGKPLIRYTTELADKALCTGLLDGYVISTDDPVILDWFPHHAVVRPDAFARDESPDIEWIQDLEVLPHYDLLVLLRPTSPFRTLDMLTRAVKQFRLNECHSMRAVEVAHEHPGKMWWLDQGCLKPVLDRKHANGVPWHSSPTQCLPVAYRQNASLEIVWRYVIDGFHSLSGNKIIPFLTHGIEGFDINTEDDWIEAEQIAYAYT